MGRYSPTAIVSLSALTLHLSLLSAVLYASRTTSSAHPDDPKYHPASAVVLTEIIKIILSTAIVFASGELNTRVDRARAEKKEHETAKERFNVDDENQESTTLEILRVCESCTRQLDGAR